MTERDRIEQVLADGGLSATDRAWMVDSCPSVVHAEVYIANRRAPAIIPIARRRRRTTLTPLGDLVAEVERRQKQLDAQITEARRVPFSALTEARVISTLVVHEWALPASPNLEVDDFADFRFRAMLAAMRALEARGAPTCRLAVVDELRRIDAREDRHVTDTSGGKRGVDEYCVGMLVLDYPPYSEPEWPHNLWWLRELAQLRRSL